MSMNLHVEATANLNGIKVAKDFDLWQTPTVVTHEALRSEDPRGVYELWVRGYPMLTQGEAHLTELAEFLDQFEGKPEWVIEWYEL